MATWFASRQNKQILKQNLELDTYKEFWLQQNEISRALVDFTVFATMQLDSLGRSVNGPPLVGEDWVQEQARKRQLIMDYDREYGDKIDDIMKAFTIFHQLWEQKEPVLYKLSKAFDTYLDEYSKIQDKLMFPTSARSNLLLLDHFNDNKNTLAAENKKLQEECLVLMVYGIDMSRLIQGELLSKYYNHRPSQRGFDAEKGYQLTRDGLVSVEKLKRKKSQYPLVYLLSVVQKIYKSAKISQK